MSKIKTKTLSFPESGSPDVSGYKLYYEVVPAEVTYTSPSVALSSNSVVLNEIPELVDADNVYNIGVASVDDGGNESDMSKLNDVPLDFAAPEPPGPLSIS